MSVGKEDSRKKGCLQLTALPKDHISVAVPQCTWKVASGLRVKPAPIKWPSLANFEFCDTTPPQSPSCIVLKRSSWPWLTKILSSLTSVSERIRPGSSSRSTLTTIRTGMYQAILVQRIKRLEDALRNPFDFGAGQSLLIRLSQKVTIQVLQDD